MSQQTASHSEEKSSWVSGLAALIVVAALVLYYTLADQSLLIRLAVLFGGIAAAVLIVAMSADGRRFIAYAKDSQSHFVIKWQMCLFRHSDSELPNAQS